MIDANQAGRKVSIEEAKRLSATQPVMVYWRPNVILPEAEQYALIFGE